MGTHRAMTIRPLLIPALTVSLLANAADPGEALYQQRCQVCHQPSGLGVPGVFPPLAGADFLVNQRERSIKALCEGLIGKITVNGLQYSGQMPAQALDDAAVAAVLNYIGTSWGNKLPTFTPQEIAAVRAKTKFPTVEKLFAAMQFAPLPQPPAGYKLRELARLLTETNLTEIEIEKEDLRVRVARTPAPVQAAYAAPAAVAEPRAPVPVSGDTSAANPGAVPSPMVGTAYRSPDPDSKPFVEVGDKVRVGQTLLIVEAMKTMNQIPAPRAGTVTKILVNDGQPVEYGEPLMIVE